MQYNGNDLKKSGIFNSDKLKIINREGKPSIFEVRVKKNVTKHLFDFLYYRELSEIGSTNIFLHNCFVEYEMSSWKIEMRNIIKIFDLDIKNEKDEIDETLTACVKKKRIYPMKYIEGNYLRIDKEGLNLISLAYYDPDIQAQLDKNNIVDNNINDISLENINEMDLDDNLLDLNQTDIKITWKALYSPNSYVPGNILYLNDNSSVDFCFSFHHVIKDNYKFYLHHAITNMRNAKLRLQITINEQIVFEIDNFPSKKILDESHVDIFNNELKDVFICDINKHMFDAGKKDLRNSLDFKFDLKSSISSEKSTESNTNSFKSNKSINSLKSSILSSNSSKGNEHNNNINIKDYTVRIRFYNTHLFYKPGWYLDGGRLVRSVYKIEK